MRVGGDLLAEGPSARLLFPDAGSPFPARARTMFLSERNFPLTRQHKSRPGKCPYPLRIGGDLLAEGQSARLIFAGARRPFPTRASAMFLSERNFSLTSQRKSRARESPALCASAETYQPKGHRPAWYFQTEAGHFLPERGACFYLGAIFR